MSNEFILYDIPSKDPPRSWSLNPWKARAALNFKGIPYKTQWVEYPDIAPTFKSYGIPKNEGAGSYSTDYSCPAAKFPDGSYVMDSRKIAEGLEKLKPEPSLHMGDGKTIDKVQGTVLEVFGHLRPIAMVRIPERLLNPRSAEYFEETRAQRFGMSLKDLSQSDKAKNAWTNADPGLQELKGILTENKDGPYVLGKEPSFSDLVIAGWVAMMKILDEGGDLFDRYLKYDKVFSEHYEACKKWLEKDD